MDRRENYLNDIRLYSDVLDVDSTPQKNSVKYS